MSYSWGDDTAKKEGSGYDYASARKAYRSEVKSARSSVSASGSMGSMKSSTGERMADCSTGERMADYRSRIGKTEAPVGKTVFTDSTHPIVIATDVTGSMSDRPGIIFEKSPLLGKEIERYAKEYAISFCAFGDAYADKYPLQVRDFDSGEALDVHISSLYPEGGGGDLPENHDLVAYYYLNHCKIDKAIKPIFIIITDVESHTNLRGTAIQKYTGDEAQGDLDSRSVLSKLGEKFSVYVLLSGNDSSKEFWEGIYGAQKVKYMAEVRDIVEFIIGIIAGEVGEVKDFEMRSSKRHEDKPERVDRVMKSLRHEKDVSPEVDGKASISGLEKDREHSKMKSKKLV